MISSRVDPSIWSNFKNIDKKYRAHDVGVTIITYVVTSISHRKMTKIVKQKKTKKRITNKI